MSANAALMRARIPECAGYERAGASRLIRDTVVIVPQDEAAAKIERRYPFDNRRAGGLVAELPRAEPGRTHVRRLGAVRSLPAASAATLDEEPSKPADRARRVLRDAIAVRGLVPDSNQRPNRRGSPPQVIDDRAGGRAHRPAPQLELVQCAHELPASGLAESHLLAREHREQRLDGDPLGLGQFEDRGPQERLELRADLGQTTDEMGPGSLRWSGVLRVEAFEELPRGDVERCGHQTASSSRTNAIQDSNRRSASS